jgi:hypothetical protein
VKLRILVASVLAAVAIFLIVAAMFYVLTLSIQTRWTHLALLSSILGSVGAFNAFKTARHVQLTAYALLFIILPWLVYGYFYAI